WAGRCAPTQRDRLPATAAPRPPGLPIHSASSSLPSPFGYFFSVLFSVFSGQATARLDRTRRATTNGEIQLRRQAVLLWDGRLLLLSWVSCQGSSHSGPQVLGVRDSLETQGLASLQCKSAKRGDYTVEGSELRPAVRYSTSHGRHRP